MKHKLNVAKLAQQCQSMPEHKSMILNGLSYEEKKEIENFLSCDIIQSNVICTPDKEFLAYIS